MERLTFEGNFCDITPCGYRICPSDGNCSQKQVWERLKAYEDAGLSPQACAEAREIEETLSSYDYSISRMVELMKADVEGRVLILPCKVGANMIDQIFKDCPRLMKNVRPAIVYVRKGVIYNMALETFEGAVSEGLIIPASEEAEKALQEMEGKKDGNKTSM